MALRGDYMTIRVQQHSSGVVNEVIAETTSVTVDFSAEALETTSQDTGLNASFIPGKVTGTASGDFFVASDNANFQQLFDHMNAGNILEVEVYTNAVLDLQGELVLTALSKTGGDSATLTTGAWSGNLSGNMATA